MVFSEREADIKVLAQNPNLIKYINDVNNKNTIEAFLENQVETTLIIYKNNVPSIQDISIISSGGIIVADTQAKNVGKQNPMPLLNNLPPHDSYYSNIIKDTKEPYMLLAMPLYNTNQYMGCIVFKLNMISFDTMVAKLNFFETGTTIIMDDNSEIAATNSTYKNKFSNINNIPPNLLSNLSSVWNKNKHSNNQNNVFRYYINGEKKIYHATTLPQNDWTVFCSIEAAEYKNFFNQTSIIVLTLIILMMIIITCYFFIKHFFQSHWKIY